jgi:DNA-binding NarL/FixJ family response regulator
MNGALSGGLPAVLAGICSASYLYFGIYILPVSLKDSRFRSLVYACIFSSAWSFCYVMYYLSGDASMRDLWQRFIFTGMLAFVLYLWFLIQYTQVIQNRKALLPLYLAMWLPSLLSVYKSITENAMARDFPLGFWFLFAEIQTTIYNLASIAVLVVFHFRNKTNKSRIQVRILCASGFVLMTLAWIADFYFAFHNSLNIIPFWMLIWIGILLYTIKKYRFITITPDFISRDITENIEEGIVLLDTKLRVIFTNRSVKSLLNAVPDEPVLNQDTVIEKHALQAEFSALMKSELDSFRIRVNIRRHGPGDKKIPVDMKVKKVIDAFNDTSGYLMVVSRVKELDQLKTLYGISARELDVIRQLAIGKTNKDIAAILNLADRTVETHITNIYTKLGTANRLELMNLLADYESFQNIRPNSAKPATR